MDLFSMATACIIILDAAPTVAHELLGTDIMLLSRPFVQLPIRKSCARDRGVDS